MSGIHAPYHFVPLSQWVYMPDWAHLVSHDHPFEDGYSGVIEYTLTNATPLCVGDEQVKTSGQPALVKWARDPASNPVIPGSSIKGMLRSVLEIIGFGKLSAIDDAQFSYREVYSKSSYLDYIAQHPVEPGWIKFNEAKGRWEFTRCRCSKIAHSEIKQFLEIEINNKDTAREKYIKCPLTTEVCAQISEPKGKQENRWAENLNQSGGEDGHLVFTNNRIKGRGKVEDYEFSYFFYKLEKKATFVDIDRQVKSLFANHSQEHIQYLKNHAHPIKGIPVFALLNGNKLHSLGLAKMPRISYNHSIESLLKKHSNAHLSDAYFDLSELIFGTLRENAFGLKSRIGFSDVYAAGGVNNAIYTSSPLILNEPKPTFYQAYLEQTRKLNKDKKFNDYDDISSLAGRKRYISKEPLNNALNHHQIKDNLNVACTMELVPVDSKFTGKLVFHNLKAEELGALIWIMELGGNNDLFHGLGHGKPFGAGAVQIHSEISLLNCNNPSSESYNKKDFIQKFIQNMEQNYPFDHSWSKSPQIQYLNALSKMTANFDVDTSYMSIDKKDYQKAKNNGDVLESFNNIERISEDYEKYCVSSAFGKGRLSHLLDKDSSWESEQLSMQSKSIEQTEERIKKIKENQRVSMLKQDLQNQKEHLIESEDLSPYDKSKSLLSLIVSDQKELTKTDLNKKGKELRDILKDIKAIDLSQEQAQNLLTIYQQIIICQKDTERAMKYLKSKI